MIKNGQTIEIEVPAGSSKEAKEVAQRMYPDRRPYQEPVEKR